MNIFAALVIFASLAILVLAATYCICSLLFELNRRKAAYANERETHKTLEEASAVHIADLEKRIADMHGISNVYVVKAKEELATAVAERDRHLRGLGQLEEMLSESCVIKDKLIEENARLKVNAEAAVRDAKESRIETCNLRLELGETKRLYDEVRVSHTKLGKALDEKTVAFTNLASASFGKQQDLQRQLAESRKLNMQLCDMMDQIHAVLKAMAPEKEHFEVMPEEAPQRAFPNNHRASRNQAPDLQSRWMEEEDVSPTAKPVG